MKTHLSSVDPAKRLTIGRLAKRVGLSRSTLLYYESEGLLPPAIRSRTNYRLYDERVVAHLEQVKVFRDAGMSVRVIRRLLEGGSPDRITRALKNRLTELNDELSALREQQRVLVRLLGNRAHLNSARALDKERWVEILRLAGLSDEDMAAWHREFERLSPMAHQDFLESLGLSKEQVAEIRDGSRALDPQVCPS